MPEGFLRLKWPKVDCIVITSIRSGKQNLYFQAFSFCEIEGHRRVTDYPFITKVVNLYPTHVVGGTACLGRARSRGATPCTTNLRHKGQVPPGPRGNPNCGRVQRLLAWFQGGYRDSGASSHDGEPSQNNDLLDECLAELVAAEVRLDVQSLHLASACKRKRT